MVRKQDHKAGTGRCYKGRRGWTLTQLLLVLSLVAVLAALMVSVFGDGRSTAYRARCDANLKTISMAMGIYLEEHRHLPAEQAENPNAWLETLRAGNYLPADTALHCPNDPRGANGSYGEYYILRAPRDAADLPVVICPFHETQNGRHGLQVFKGRYTRQFITRPAIMESANNATVEAPGKQPVVAYARMPLKGGDRIRTGPAGLALIRFVDGSSSELQANSDITVLQSFVEEQSSAPLYSLVRQTLGDVTHSVHHGSKFDVATPTATVGAHGTVFRIIVTGQDEEITDNQIKVLEGKVIISTQESHWEAPNGQWQSLGKKSKKKKDKDKNNKK